MRYWWVNHNQTFSEEVGGGFLWSPKTKANGDRNYFYDTMLQASIGDVVISYAGSKVQAIGVVRRPAYETPKPDFGSAGSNWNQTGWFLEVEFERVPTPFRPMDHLQQFRPLLPEKYSPIISKNGYGAQGAYLAEISQPLADLVLCLANEELQHLIYQLSDPNADDEEQYVREEIQLRQIQGDLEQIQLVKARRGQGIFKANLRTIEHQCRVTSVNDIRHLRASHIKPWSKASDAEKIDGANGLLLAPHVDHLFDRGYISFEGNGSVIASSRLDRRILNQWGIALPLNVGEFNDRQNGFLEYHRSEVLKTS